MYSPGGYLIALIIANTIPITTIATITIRKSFSNPSINDIKP